MSKILSNRILKSPYVVFDKENTVTIYNEAPPSEMDIEEVEINPFTDPGLAIEHEILSEEAELTEQELASRIIERARSEADAIVRAAREDAEIILDQMEAQAQEAMKLIEEQVRERGYADGYDKGMAQAEAIKEDARILYANAERERKESFDSMESDVLELIIEVLHKLLTDTININPQTILNLIRKGFSEARLSGDVTIHVSEADYDEVFANKELFAQYADVGAKIEVFKDYSLKKSDCIIETPYGTIDCSLDHQYESVRKNLYYIFENG